MQLVWSQTVATPLRGLHLARESESILAWNGKDLLLFNHAGILQAQRPTPAALATASGTEDGSAFAAAYSQPPLICLLSPDLTPRWQRTLSHAATAVAFEPLGRLLAVADAGGTLTLLDARGRTQWRATTPRPLHHLAFVAEKRMVVGSADFGLVVGLGATGEGLWRDGLVAHVGALAVSGDGAHVLLACFGDGLHLFNADGQRQESIALNSPCHLAALSYAGDCLLTADRGHRLALRDAKGTLREEVILESCPLAAALGARGDFAVVGLETGRIQRYACEREMG